MPHVISNKFRNDMIKVLKQASEDESLSIKTRRMWKNKLKELENAPKWRIGQNYLDDT